MSESQSRYSIVANLTKSKLDLMSAKHEVTDNIEVAKQRYENLKEQQKIKEEQIKKDLKVQIEHYTREAEDARRGLILELAKTEQTFKNLESRKSDKIKLYEEKITAIDAALEQLKIISETSNSQK